MARVLTVLGFLVLVLVANWPYVYEEVLVELVGSGVKLMPGTTATASLTSPTFAGWPCKFYQSVGELDELRVASFKWSAMLLNIFFWSIVPIAFGLYEVLSATYDAEWEA